MKRRKKKEQTNINAIEGYLSEIAKVHKNQDDQHYVYIGTLHESQQYRHLLSTFYHQSPWVKKQNYGMERFNEKAYASAAKALVRNPEDLKLKPRQVKPVVIYGDSGQGHGSRIEEYQLQNTTKLQHSVKEKAKVYETNEYLTSKLCCLCDSRVVHPRRRNSTKLNSEIVVCINSNCIGRKNGFASRGRDQHAAINILKKEIYKMATNIDYPAFTPPTVTTVTAQILLRYLFCDWLQQ
ncbi:hypothetical protein BC941DRAFT_473212 [Chlamydoabsidia padenii]|nr:hypothetical protein BC941DRAFT_473212 [Chlamydoabsidia padenii]